MAERSAYLMLTSNLGVRTASLNLLRVFSPHSADLRRPVCTVYVIEWYQSIRLLVFTELKFRLEFWLQEHYRDHHADAFNSSQVFWPMVKSLNPRQPA